MAATTLVTGAAGFAGGHLIDLLAASGTPVVAWHRPGGAPPFHTPLAAWEGVDLLDAPAVRDALARLRPSAVYHCAGAAHVGRSWDQTESTFAINVRGTHHLFEGLRLARVHARVVLPGSAMIYRAADEALTEDSPLQPSSPYGLSKLAQELLGPHAAADGIDVMSARSFNHIGPRQDPSFAAASFARQIGEIEAGLREPELVVGNLQAKRDLTDVRDVARAYRVVMERGTAGRAYNVCSGHAVVIRDLLDALIGRARVPIRVRVDPERYRPNDVPLVLGSPARIRDELGWRPLIPFEQTLDDLLAYWRRVQT